MTKPRSAHRAVVRWAHFDWSNMLLVGLAMAVAWAPPAGGQIAIDGQYWKLDGQRVLLLGAWNHGHNPFIDHDTDNDQDAQGVSTVEQITAAMDDLSTAGGNCLRCVLNPGMAAAIQGFDFCARSESKYDLSEMVGPFWTRLETFVAEARKRGMVVQIEVWDRFDWIDGSWGSWPGSPWNPKNNVNYTPESTGLATTYGSFHDHPFSQGVPGHPKYEAADKARKEQYNVVRGFQEKFVERLLSITLRCDNVLYCMNNETHEDPAWGQYWMNFIKSSAKRQGKAVLTTDMFDDVYKSKDSRGLGYQLEHRDRYDYIDISQVNSRHADEQHWNHVSWIADAAAKVRPPYLLHMTKLYGSDLALKGEPWSQWKPGDAENAIEEWWRNLLVGVAGVRFHRPTTGLGLCDVSRNSIRATRKVESLVKFWDVKPRLDLLSERDSDEAYLAADPGSKYILYFTKSGAGSVGLKLDGDSDKGFQIHWVNVDTGNWGPRSTMTAQRVVTIERPDGSAHWVAVLVR